MAVRITYHCPHCGSDINAQYWLPPVSYEHECASCGNTVVRSGQSIRDGWGGALVWIGFLPLWLLVCFMPGFAQEKLGARLVLAFLATTLFGILALSLVGRLVGLFVSMRPAPRPEDPYDAYRC